MLISRETATGVNISHKILQHYLGVSNIEKASDPSLQDVITFKTTQAQA